MSLDLEMLRSSFALVSGDPHLTRRFYERLFERHPDVRRLFPGDALASARQEKMLAHALAAVVEHLDDEGWLRKTLLPLGARHVHYGVTEEMYPWVAESLLDTLGDVAGEAWSDAHRAAWADALGAVAGLMMEGARHVALAPRRGLQAPSTGVHHRAVVGE